MKTSIKFIAPALGAAAIGATLLLAPIASADTDPLVPYGTDPHGSYVLGYHVSNHDESSHHERPSGHGVLIHQPRRNQMRTSAGPGVDPWGPPRQCATHRSDTKGVL